MAEARGVRVGVQKFGGFMSRMVMPNIGAFLAWGLVTAFFLATGWTPNEQLATLIDPTMKYLLPTLIAYTGGTMVHGKRGGVIGAIAAIGVVIGAEMTMLLGAMAMGPFAAWCLKQVDKFFDGKVKPGFEMLVSNFSLGILGAILMCLGFLAVGPIFSAIMSVLTMGVDWVVSNGLTPLAAIFVSPGQVLFLNNAINHGIMVPLGTEQVAQFGKSILFFVEANNGPMSGVLLAFCLFGRGVFKRTAPGSLIIALFGGIGEVYFPYVLAKPKMILGTILGSMTSIFIFQTFGGGAVAAPSPGSIFAFIMVSPPSCLAINLIGFFAGMAVAFVVSMLLLKTDKSADDEGDAEMLAGTLETAGISTAAVSAGASAAAAPAAEGDFTAVKTVYVCCDAGMGSSAMGASVLKSKVQKAGLAVTVANKQVDNIPDDVDMVITLEGLVDRARASAPREGVIFYPITNFLDNSQYDVIVGKLKGEE